MKRLFLFLLALIGLCLHVPTTATNTSAGDEVAVTPTLPQSGKYYFIVSLYSVYPSKVIENRTVYIDPTATIDATRLKNHDYDPANPSMQDLFLIEETSEGLYTMQHYNTGKYAGNCYYSNTPVNLYVSEGTNTVNGTSISGFYISVNDPTISGNKVWSTYTGTFNWIDPNNKSLYVFVEAPGSLVGNDITAAKGIAALQAKYNEILAKYKDMTSPTYDDAAFTEEIRTNLLNKLNEAAEAIENTPSGENSYYTNLADELQTTYEAHPWIDGGSKFWPLTIDSIADGRTLMLETACTGYRNKFAVAYPDRNSNTSVMINDEGKDNATIWQLVATGKYDAIYTDKPTYYLKDTASGKYYGTATSITSINEGDKRMVDNTDMAYSFCFLTQQDIKDKQSVTTNLYGCENPVFIHHSNSDGTWFRLSRFGTQEYMSYISSSFYPGNADWQTWLIYSGDKNFNISSELSQTLEDVEGISADFIGTDPGYYPEEKLMPFFEAKTAALAITTENSRQEYRNAIDNLKATYSVAAAAEPAPLTDGYYYIRSAWQSKSSLNLAAYDPNNGNNKLGWHTLDPNSLYDIFEIKKIEEGKYSVQNLGSKLYVNKQENNNYVSMSETLPTDYYQIFTYKENACFQWEDNSYHYTYYINGSGNNGEVGRYYPQAVAYAFDRWRLNSVSQEFVEALINGISFNLNEGKLVATGNNISLDNITNALNDNPATTVLDLSSAAIKSEITAEQLSAALKGNQIVVLPNGSALSGKNLIADGNCSNLVLTDKANFTPKSSFTAETATYTKTGLDGSGWYSVVLPYDVKVPSGMEVLNNAVLSGSTIKFDAVAEGTTISANTPFLYKTADNSVAFNATNATVNATAGVSGDLKGTYVLIPAGEATGKLILNATGSAFGHATSRATIPAFRAFVDDNGSSSSNTFSIVINDELTGVADAATLNGQGSLVDVYTIDGTLVRSQVDPLTALQGLPKGTYIVNGKTYKK